MSEENKKETPVVITLRFKSVVSTDRKGETVYEKKEEGGKIVDDKDSPRYDRNDILAFFTLLNAMDVSKLKLQEERQLLMITEKIRERWKAEDWDCSVEFSVKESAFIQQYLEDVNSKIRSGVNLTQYYSMTKIALLDQLEENK